MYANVARIEALMPMRAPFGTATRPTASGVAVMIEHATGEAHGILSGAGYDVPVATAAQGFEVVQTAVTARVQALVEDAAATGKPGRADDLRRAADRLMDSLRSMSGIEGADGSEVRRPRGGSVDTDPFFTRDMSL